MLVLPWTVRAALIALLTFALGVGVVAIVLLFRLAGADHVDALLISGRLAAPTGYFNSTAALFTIEALTAIALAARRELPGLLRGALIGFACAGLQLAVVVQSRGWLFTLPLIAIVAIVVVRDRLRFAAAAVIPALAALAPLRRLLHVYQAAPGAALDHAASRAGHSALLVCGLAFVAATLIFWGESLMPARQPSALRRRVLGTIAVFLAIGAALVGGLAATHGDPLGFISRQWNGFSHQEVTSAHAGSHFNDVGSGRYDFWRVGLDAFLAHPVGGLGQDNFVEYYVAHGRTSEQPAWTHSLEIRLLTHTGLVGFALFATFLAAAVAAAIRARRRPGLPGALAGMALLPLVVWLIHGSLDWFWEIPALTAPALGFLAMAAALGAAEPPTSARTHTAESPGARIPAGASSPTGEPEIATGPTGEPEIPPGATDTASGLRAPAGVNDGSSEPMTPAGAIPAAARPTHHGLWVAAGVAGGLALVAAVIALGFSYLSVREVSIATDARQTDPAGALRDLSTAADLNPLSAEPGAVAGTIALQTGRFAVATERFQQAIARDPGGWFQWLGAGLAASAQGEKTVARRDYEAAAALNSKVPVIQQALAGIDSRSPLSPAAALQELAQSLS
jgi:O-antigen ligase